MRHRGRRLVAGHGLHPTFRPPRHSGESRNPSYRRPGDWWRRDGGADCDGVAWRTASSLDMGFIPRFDLSLLVIPAKAGIHSSAAGRLVAAGWWAPIATASLDASPRRWTWASSHGLTFRPPLRRPAGDCAR